MPTVRIKIRTPERVLAGYRADRIYPEYEDVDLDELSPRARALAEAISHCPGGVASTIRLESDQRIRDVQPNWEMWYTAEQADEPLRMDWGQWDKLPATSTMTAVQWLERQIAKIPAGYRIVGATRTSLGGAPEVVVDDSSDLMTAEEVVAYLASKGRHMTAGSWRAKVNHAAKSGGSAPQPADRVGRTPLWLRADVDAWLGA